MFLVLYIYIYCKERATKTRTAFARNSGRLKAFGYRTLALSPVGCDMYRLVVQSLVSQEVSCSKLVLLTFLNILWNFLRHSLRIVM